jgi:hypothetical protein
MQHFLTVYPARLATNYEPPKNPGRYLPAKYANGDRLNPVEFVPMNIGRLRMFNHGFTRFFLSLDDWLLLVGNDYPPMAKAFPRHPIMVDDYRYRFFNGINK